MHQMTYAEADSILQKDYDEILSDGEIAARHGFSASFVTRWRKWKGLSAHTPAELSKSARAARDKSKKTLLCKSCFYYRGDHIKTCDYILITRRSRGCAAPSKPGDECAKYISKDRKENF